MNKHFARRRSVRILAAACGSLALAANLAKAELHVEVIAVPDEGDNYNTSGDGKTVDVLNMGAPVTLGVYARISGQNGVQQSGNFDGQGDALDKRNDDLLQALVGSFHSVGSLLGDMGSPIGPLNPGYDSRVAPFTAPGSQNGTAADWDGDGDLDIGGTGTDVTPMWVVRSNRPSTATLLDGADRGWTLQDNLAGGPLFDLNDEDTIIDATTARLRIGTLEFTPTNGSGSTLVQFIVRPPYGVGGYWWEDGSPTAKFPDTDLFTIGAPVTISFIVPEPACAGLLAVASVGLLARRRGGPKC